VTDEGLVPDPDRILSYFEEEFDGLYEISKTGKVDIKPIEDSGRKRRPVKPKKKKTVSKNSASGNASDAIEGPDTDKAKQPGICTALTKSGRPCKNKSVPGSKYCRIHQKKR
jgi:hypothetical protein